MGVALHIGIPWLRAVVEGGRTLKRDHAVVALQAPCVGSVGESHASEASVHLEGWVVDGGGVLGKGRVPAYVYADLQGDGDGVQRRGVEGALRDLLRCESHVDDPEGVGESSPLEEGSEGFREIAGLLHDHVVEQVLVLSVHGNDADLLGILHGRGVGDGEGENVVNLFRDSFILWTQDEVQGGEPPVPMGCRLLTLHAEQGGVGAVQGDYAIFTWGEERPWERPEEELPGVGSLHGEVHVERHGDGVLLACKGIGLPHDLLVEPGEPVGGGGA